MSDEGGALRSLLALFRIQVDSELGKGSTFTIRLPVKAGGEGQTAEKAP